MNKYDNLEQQLYKYFKIEGFRKGQKEIIHDVLCGRDVLGVLPTGSGKSICYQLPAMVSEGITIVVSPLIALMVDQVKQMKAIGLKRVAAVNSFLPQSERRYILQHLDKYKLIYVSPETLQHKEMIDPICRLDVSLFVIDEAHCISQWGYEFRPDYMRLGGIIEKLGDPTVLALSATATGEVQKDIAEVLRRPKIVRHIYPIDKENLTFMVETTETENEKVACILSLMKNCSGPILIYFSSRQMTEKIAARVSRSSGKRTAAYHGGLEQMDRLFIQQQFMLGQLDVICCTSAFGMGIDKSDIRIVIHYHIPPDIKSYIQEAGRAGRDGKTSLCVLLYAKHDEFLVKQLIDKEIPSKETVSQAIQMFRHGQKQQSNLNEETFVRLLGLSESQWHFMQNQLEKHDMIVGNKHMLDDMEWKSIEADIQSYASYRRNQKEKRVYEMLAFVHSDACRRMALYKHFQLGFTKTPICCDNCGFSLTDLNLPERKMEHKLEKPWRVKLQDLLFIGTNNR